MSISTSATPSLVLSDRIAGRRSWVVSGALVAIGAALVALLAQVEVPLFPVPITGQTLAVLLVGASLGAKRGAASLLLYLVAGLAGVPVFAGLSGGLACVMKPSFGFIVGFVFAAGAVGWMAERSWDKTVWRTFVAAVAGTIIPFLFGLPYLALMLPLYGLPNDLPSVLEFGLWPFIIGGVLKAGIAAVALPIAWRIADRRRAPERK